MVIDVLSFDGLHRRSNAISSVTSVSTHNLTHSICELPSSRSADLNERRGMKVKPTPRSFKAWPENQERLVFAEKLDMNVSELINEVLKENLKRHLEKKTQKIREALSAPIP